MPELKSKTKTRNLIERLLIFFVGIPVVFALVFLLPFYKHLALNIVIILFSALGAVEFSVMLQKKNIIIGKVTAFILGSLAPLAALITIVFDCPSVIVGIIILPGIMWALLSQIFSKKDKMETVLNYFVGCITVMVYPGFFMYWLSKMTSWESSTAIFLFLLIVFFNDSIAWLIGSLFGKNNKGLIPASPNKSIAGFIGGMIGSVGICVISKYLFFPSMLSSLSILFVILLGFFTGIFATLGDLAESALKRSSEIKDSGNIILGRGGILDSIDSIAAAAPVYYLLYNYFVIVL